MGLGLSDGRLKCPNCARRYKPRRIWDLSRLPEASKNQLLERFVFGILKRNGLARVSTLNSRKYREIPGKGVAPTTLGSLDYTDDRHAYASLSLRGGHIVIRKQKVHPRGRDPINRLEGFWSYAKRWLYPYRGVPRRYFHLYLGVVAFRFNHRDQDLVPVLKKLMMRPDGDLISQMLVRAR